MGPSINHRLRAIARGRFVRYLAVGAASTLVDWGVFYLLSIRAGLHYQPAVVVSVTLATLTHYVLNKWFTFRCTSREILRQLGAHATVSVVYLLASMGAMYLLVDVMHLSRMPSKMATTIVMTIASYALHSMVTFNKRFFP